jgi:mono/diheme cytochrome c family protein
MRVQGKRLFRLSAVCLALAAAGCGPSGPQQPAAAGPVPVRVVYERTCATCHGLQGEGKELGTMKVPSLRQGAVLTDPDDKLFKQISDGGKGMPPFKYTLDDRQINDLVRFIREEIQKK